MGTSMPLVVHKGETVTKLEARWKDPAMRFQSLLYHRWVLDPANPPPWVARGEVGPRTSVVVGRSLVETAAGTPVLTGDEPRHFDEDWFGPMNTNFFRVIALPRTATGEIDITGQATLTNMSTAAAERARLMVTRALVEALELSLGLEDGDSGGLALNDKGSEWAHDSAKPARDWPIAIYWVCGKADGFDVEIFWDKDATHGEGLVTLFIVTPPIARDFGMPGATPKPYRRAKVEDGRGALLIRNLGRWMARFLVPERDGGVTY